jgi:hypothetical protein
MLARFAKALIEREPDKPQAIPFRGMRPRLFGGQKIVGHKAEVRRISRRSEEWIAECSCGWSDHASGSKARRTMLDSRERHFLQAVDAGAAVSGGGREPPTSVA